MHTHYCESVESTVPKKVSCDSRCSRCHESQASSNSEDCNPYEESTVSDRPSIKSLGDLPVDINECNTTAIDLPPLYWSRYNYPPKILTVSNTGRTILINGQWTCSKPYIRGGPLNGSYIFSQIHFHCPSEHKINGKRFPLEMHVVHYKTCYLTQERAMHEKDGTVVLVYLFKEVGFGKTVLSRITNLMPFIEKINSKKQINKLTLEQIVQPFASNYYVYWGSVNTDKNSYLLQWIINCNHLYVTKQEVTDMLNIMNASGSFNSNRLARMRPENNAIFRVGAEEPCEYVSRSGSADSASKVFSIMSKMYCDESRSAESSEKTRSKSRIKQPPCSSTTILKVKRQVNEKRKEKACQIVATINESTNTSPQSSQGDVQKDKHKKNKQKQKVSSQTQTDDSQKSETSTIFHSEGGSYNSNTETKEFFKDGLDRQKPHKSDTEMVKWLGSDNESFKNRFRELFSSGSLAQDKLKGKLSDSSKVKIHGTTKSAGGTPDSLKSKTPERVKSKATLPDSSKSQTPEKVKSTVSSPESSKSKTELSDDSKTSNAKENTEVSESKHLEPTIGPKTKSPPPSSPPLSLKSGKSDSLKSLDVRAESDDLELAKHKNEAENKGKNDELSSKDEEETAGKEDRKVKIRNESEDPESAKKRRMKSGVKSKHSDKALKPCKPTKSRFFKSLKSSKPCEPVPSAIKKDSSHGAKSKKLSDLKTLFRKKHERKRGEITRGPRETDDAKKVQVNFLMAPNTRLNTYSAGILTTESESLTQEKEISMETESQEGCFSPIEVSRSNATPSSSESLLNTTDMDVIDEPEIEPTITMQVDTRGRAKEKCTNELKELCLHMEHSFRSENREGSHSSFTCQEYYVAIEYDHNILQEYRGAFNPYQLVPGSSEKLTLVPKYKESKGLQIRLEDCAVKVESMDLVCVKAKFLLKKGSVQEMLNNNCFFKSAQEKFIRLFDAETQSTIQEFDLANLTNLTGIKLLEGKGDPQAGFKLSQGTQWEDPYAKEDKKNAQKKQGDQTKEKYEDEGHESGVGVSQNRIRESFKDLTGEDALKMKRALVDGRQCKIKLLKNPNTYRDDNSETTSNDTMHQSLEGENEGHGGDLSSSKSYVEAKRSVMKNKKTVYFMYDRIEKDAVTGKKVFVGSFRTKEEVEAPTPKNVLLHKEQPGTLVEPGKKDFVETYKMTSSENENSEYSEEVVNIRTRSTKENLIAEGINIKSSDILKKDLITLHKFKPTNFASSKSIKSTGKNFLIGRVVNRMQQEKGNVSNISEVFGMDKKPQGNISIREFQDSSENNVSTAWSDSDNFTESELTRKTGKKTSTNIEMESSTCESDGLFGPKKSEDRDVLDESSENFGSSDHFPKPESTEKDSQATIIIIPIEVESLSKIELILIEHSDDVTKEKQDKEYIPCLNCYKRSVFELKVYLFIF